ncbi:MAG: hypothetical protein AAGA77_05305 [Bacteroidota bacterium]
MKQIDPSEINIIDYISGEMNEEEMKQFELQLENNPLLKARIEDMRAVQQQLGVWKNEDINIPAFEPSAFVETVEQPLPHANSRRLKLPNWLKYAAAIVGFTVLLQLIGLEINKNGNTLMLSFGEPNTETISSGQIDAIVARAIDKYAEDQNRQFVAFKDQVNSDLSGLSASIDEVSSNNKVNLAEMENMFNKNMDGQYVRLESMFKAIEDNQRQELEDSFTGLVEYIENKRRNDQYKIQNAFSEIATAIDDHQFRTNALLTSMTDEAPVLKSY